MVPLEQLVLLGKAAGLSVTGTNFTASAVVDLNVTGAWANFSPPHVHGTAHLENLTAWIPGIKDRLLLPQADAQFNDSTFVLTHINGQFEHSPVSFTGTVTSPWSCQTHAVCVLEFDLRSEALKLSDVAGLFTANESGWSLPFLSASPSSGKLPLFRAKGTLSVDQLTAAQIPLEKFTGHVEVGDQSLVVSHVAAKVGGGAMVGEFRVDWTGSEPSYSASGTLSGVALDRLGGAKFREVLDSWITGRADAKYSLHLSGKTSEDLLSSAAGRLDFTVGGGSSRILLLEASKPWRFQSLQGSLELEKRTLKVLPSKFRADNRIYEVSGNVTLADQQAMLKITNGGSRWEITGALDQPRLAAPRTAAQAASARSR
jgi:hypothetical protein